MTNLRVFRAGTRVFGAKVPELEEGETGSMSTKYTVGSVVVLLIFQSLDMLKSGSETVRYRLFKAFLKASCAPDAIRMPGTQELVRLDCADEWQIAAISYHSSLSRLHDCCLTTQEAILMASQGF